jgi:hypothetical protein
MSKTPETDAFLAKGCTIPELQAFARKLEKRMNEARESHHNAIIENARLKQELNDADLACNYWMKQVPNPIPPPRQADSLH